MQDDSPKTEKTIMTIPSGHAFLARLAETLLHDRTLGGQFGGELDKSFALHDFTILLPTRRAVRALQAELLAQSAGDALLMPDIRSLGEMGEDGDAVAPFFALSDASMFNAPLDFPLCLDGLPRENLLMKLVMHWGKVTGRLENAVQAAALASDLAAFLDHATTEEVGLERLVDIVPENFSANWQQTLDFLDIITKSYPALKTEMGAIDPPEARRKMLDLQTEFLRVKAATQPVIAAGSTGSIPATQRMLEAIAGAPYGAIILPGLDQEMSHSAWAQVKNTPSHPQAGLYHLLDEIGVSRRQVTIWDSCKNGACKNETGASEKHFASFTDGGLTDRGLTDRRRFLNMALLPANQTGQWVTQQNGAENGAENGTENAPPNTPPNFNMANALKGLSLIEADDNRQEAGVIALALREVLETPDKTAILVTPDRQLARRVAAEMTQWGVDIDDTGGKPLSNQPAGRFVRAVLETLAQGFAPISFLTVLKHELVHLGKTRAQHIALVRQFEYILLRGPAPAEGFDGLRAHAEGQLNNKRKKKFWTVIENDLLPLIENLAQVFAPLTLLGHQATLQDLAKALLATCEKLTRDDTGEVHIWRGVEGEVLHRFVTDLEAVENMETELFARADWNGLLTHWMRQRPVRQSYGQHKRLSIMGLLEARLVQADLMILGGLNEGVWPRLPDTGPWVSRPMRVDLGMTAPERDIGLMAHDFVQAASAPNVLLTRAKKQGGAPMVGARWLTRMTAVVKGRLGAEATLPSNETLLHYWRMRNKTQAARQLPDAENWLGANHKPLPKPDADLRPNRLSVTRVQKLQSNPYAIYAQYVLGLEKLDPLQADSTAAARGIFVHKVLETFVAAYPDVLPENTAVTLQIMARDLAETETGGRDILTFWWSRFVALSEWFADFEKTRRAGNEGGKENNGIEKIWTEQFGFLRLTINDKPFTISGIADRIEQHKNGRLSILDYKTGAVPSAADVKNYRDSQMPLLGLMALRGGFPDIAAHDIEGLAYIRTHGGYPAGEVHDIESPQDLMTAVMKGLQAMLETYGRGEVAYEPHIRPKLIKYDDDYAHLARVREWSSESNDSGEGNSGEGGSGA